MESDNSGISLGGDGAEINVNEANAEESLVVDNAATENPENASEKLPTRISIEQFYDLMVADFASSRGSDYHLYLLQGNVSPSVIYSVVGLPRFQAPEQDDVERIKEWCDDWSKESEKFQRVDIEKSEVTRECVDFLRSFFVNKIANEELNESLRKVSMGQLDVIIKSKCNDNVVELPEMLEIMENAESLGFLDNVDRKEFVAKVIEKIEKNSSRIDDVKSAFIRYFNERKSMDTVNAVNSEKNRQILFKKYKEFQTLHDRIYGNENSNDDAFYSNNLVAFLSECGLVLDSPVASFTDNYFESFKRSHDLSAPLSLSDFSELQAAATISYGLSQQEWSTFVSENAIAHETVATQSSIDEMNARIKAMEEAQKNSRQDEIDALNAKIAELEKKQDAAVKITNTIQSGFKTVEGGVKSGLNAVANAKSVVEKKVAEKKVEIDQFRQQHTQQKNQQQTQQEQQTQQPDAASDRNKGAMILLCFFLGIFGLHHFYSGNKKKGVIMLALFIFGMILMNVGIGILMLAAAYVWWFIDLVNIIRGKYRDGKGRYVK